MTFKQAKRKFPVGCKVEVEPDAGRPEWRVSGDKVVCGHERYRDSDDDPIICVCCVSLEGAFAGWFTPDRLKRVKR